MSESEWDDARAQALVGKTLLVGVTYVDSTGKEESRDAAFGRIVAISEANGVVVHDQEREEPVVLTPFLDALEPAEPGEYRLRVNGRIVVDPDLTATWTVERPDGGD